VGPRASLDILEKQINFLSLSQRYNAQLFKIQCHSNPSLLYGMLLYVATFLRQTAD